MRFLFVLLLACGVAGEPSTPRPEAEPEPGPESHAELDLPTPESFVERHDGFESYWYQGKAELTRYELTQSRYGETHEGHAVLVFVTEDFRTDLQVKRERPSDAPHESVLKLNAYRRFYTGIYPYTVTTSTFLPARGEGATFKLSTVVTEWCGNAYVQLNRREGSLQGTSHSYFEAEADETFELGDAPLEDALFSRIRRDPESLPTGALTLVPAVHALRFAHRDHAVEAATATLEDAPEDGPFTGARAYAIRYEYGRTLTIYFDDAFPHVIRGWEEGGEGPTTRAVRTHAVLDDYWAHHGSDDDAYRRALGL